MVTNILIGIGCFILGGVISALSISKMLMKVNAIYNRETGNDFITWVFNRSNKVRTDRYKKDYLKTDAED